MKNEKSVSILIPTFNRAHYLNKAIDSSLEQNYPVQVVVCDHGSTDNTPEIVKRYGAKLTYIRREKDFGPHFCWLEGLLNCDSEYIHIQFDDDWIDKNFIGECMKLMQDDVGFVFSEVSVFHEEKNNYSENLFAMKDKKFKTGIYNNEKIENLNLMISPGACIYRKQDLIDALYQGKLPISEMSYYHGVGPDHFIMLLTFLRYKKFGHVNKNLAFFRDHKASITINAHSQKSKSQQINAAYESVRDYYKFLKSFNDFKIKNLNKKRTFVKRIKRSIKKRLSN